MSEAEKRQLQHELKQMWDTVPPQELARARELAGVQPGQEHKFRVAAVQDVAVELRKEGVRCTAELPQPEIQIRFGLSDGDVDP